MIRGYVEAIRPFQVRGWVYDTEAPDEPVPVFVGMFGEDLASREANIFREDLLKDGIGGGRHGFVINIDQRLPTAQPELLEIRALSRSGSLEEVPLVADVAIEDPITSRVSEHSQTLGFYRLVSPTIVAGWAYDPETPDEHLMVEILIDGQSQEVVLADELREDLVVALIGKGDHGFTVTVAPPITTSAEITVIARSAAGRSGHLRQVRVSLGPNALMQSPTVSITSVPHSVLEAMPISAMRHGFRYASVDHAHRPVFILGAARSGTSAMAQALMNVTRYQGQEEGHLLNLMPALLLTVRQYYEEQEVEWRAGRATMLAMVPRSYLEQGVRQIFVEMARTIFPGGLWFDKTPGAAMINTSPYLREIWPEARFVFMKRRGIENIMSRIKKYPTLTFEEHCHTWVSGMQCWTAVRTALSGFAIEIDQRFLWMQPDKVASVLGSFLRLQPEEESTLGQALALDLPERTSERLGALMSLASAGWTRQQQDAFLSICGPTMDQFGYTLDEQYLDPAFELTALQWL